MFSLDADERCTEAAAAEIRRLIEQPGAADAYLVPRRNFFFGRWIAHSGWFPDYRQPQLFRRGKLSYTADAVHETYVLDGTLGKTAGADRAGAVPGPRAGRCTRCSATRRSASSGWRSAGTTPSMCRRASAHGLGAFLRHYVVRAGFLDGWAGFIIAFSNFEGTFYRYAKYAERMNALTREPPLPR